MAAAGRAPDELARADLEPCVGAFLVDQTNRVPRWELKHQTIIGVKLTNAAHVRTLPSFRNSRRPGLGE